MKKFITVLLSLSMAVSSIGTLAFAEGETTSYNVGDLVWSEDFESFEDGYDYAANPTNGITFSTSSTNVVGSAKVKEDASGDSYLYVSAENSKGTASVRYNMFVPAGDAAQGDDKIFTIDLDMKLDYFDADDVVNTKAAEYDFGLGSNSFGSYITLAPTSSNNTTTSGIAVNRSASGTYIEKVASKFVHRIEGEEAQAKRIAANAWNTYRFIARKMVATADDVEANSKLTEGETYYYADMYVNGQYFYLIGQRTTWNATQDYFAFRIAFNEGITKGGVSVDNLKCYYGAVESNEYVTKGEFAVDTYKFDECTVGENVYVNDSGTYRAVVAGGDADHAFGKLERYNRWGMNLDINSGKAGKATGDNSLSVHTGGRVIFETTTSTVKSTNPDGSVKESYTGTAVNSVKNGTWVPEGDSLEFSADVLFKDLKENWLFQLTTAVDSQLVAIEITPNFYSVGGWEKAGDDFQNYRQRIAPKIPLNTWVNLRVIITRGTSDALNKLTIYADDNVVCENVDIASWYKITSSTADGVTTYTRTTEQLNGAVLAKGFSGIYFNGECDYDNITIKKYLLGQTFSKPETVPSLVDQTTKVTDYPSLRGKIYTDGRSIQSVIDAMGITGDYVVRDASGNAVTDYTKPADGNYIEFDANGKKYYGAFAANNVVETINETSGDLGGFTFDETVVSVESVTKGQGRDANDTSIKLTNNSEAEAIDDTQRFIKALNTDENAYMEFSFLADENTDFYVGYNVYYVRNGSTEGYSTKLGAPRGYYDHIRIADNEVRSTNGDNGKRLVGTYKDGEWTKVRLEWNSMNNNFVAVSVNGGTSVLLNAGPDSYFKTIRNIVITPAANTSAVLDDIVVMEGYKSAPTAAAVTDITEKYVYNVDGVLSIPADMSNVYMSMNALGSSIGVSPLAASKKWIKADGSVASGSFDAVDKLVLLNDGIYTYYTVKNREGITEFKNADGTSKMVVDVINANVVDLTGSKLISAVYNTEDGTLASAVMHDLTFENETYTTELNITPQSYDSATQTMRYFAWKLDGMECLCDSYEVK